MIWSVQLTPWALPFLLGVLIAVRDTNVLWPVRREPGALALLVLVAASGAWAFLHLLIVSSASLEVKLALTRIELVAAAVAPLGWAWFGISFSRRVADVIGLPTVVLAGLSLVPIWLVLNPGLPSSLFGETGLQERNGIFGLVTTRGFWHWILVAVRIAAVIAATAAIALYVAGADVSGLRVATLAVAAMLALLPTVVHITVAPRQVWLDLSSVGFVLASSVLRWGVFRERLEGLGPVARNLVMEELHDPIVVIDGRGRIVDVNRAGEELLDFRPYGDVPLSLGTLWASARRTGTEELARVELPVRMKKTAPGGEEEEKKEDEGELQEEEKRTFEVTVTPLEGKKGQGRAVLLLRDVTARDRMEQELREAHRALTRANEDLERLANTDALTELANRRHFMDMLAAEIDRAKRYGRPLSVVLMDLDHFKKANDSYGHAAGDEVLRNTASALRSVCRDQDLAARIGGEEFALVLPETGSEGARVVAERLRSRLEGKQHESPEGDAFTVTGSMGVATLDADVAGADRLLQRADQALYEAKRSGRNRVCQAP